MLNAGKRAILRIQNQLLIKVITTKRPFSKPNSTPTPVRKPKRICGLVQAAWLTGGTILLACGSTIVYAKYNEKFRKDVEKYVPGSHTLLTFLLGAIYDCPNRAGKKKETDLFEQPMLANKSKTLLDRELLKLSKPKGKGFVGEQTPTKISEVPASPKADTVESKAPSSSVGTTVGSVGSALAEPSSSVETTVSSVKPTLEEPSSSIDCVEPPSSLVGPNDSNQYSDAEKYVPMMAPELDEPIVHDDRVKLTCKDKDAEIQDACSLSLENPEALRVTGLEVTPIKPKHKDDKVKIRAHNVSNDQRLQFEASTAILDDMLSGCSVVCANAILSNNEAANAVEVHTTLLRTAMDDLQTDPNGKSQQWSDVGLALNEKAKKCGEADVCYEKAIEELTKLKEGSQQMDCENDLIQTKVIDLQRTINDLTADLNDSLVKVIEQKIKYKIMEQYQSSIESAKSDLRKELPLPEGKKMEDWKRQGVQLKSREELDALRQLNEQMEELQAKLLEERKQSAAQLQDAVESVRNNTINLLKMESEETAQLLLKEKQIAHDQALKESREKHTNEYEAELKIQSMKHAEHLAEALAYMDKQAREKYESALQKEIEIQWEVFEKKLESQKASFDEEASNLIEKHKADMTVAMAQLRGIKQAVDNRADTESEMRKALELSLACDSLLDSLKNGNDGAPSPLKPHVEAIRGVYGDHPAVAALSSSLPREVQERGAFPEATLQRHLSQVMTTCRRVSLVDENRNSLFVYFLSYLKSFLIITNSAEQPPSFIDTSDLDCFKILSYANYCLQHGDIEQAVRFMNQLQGESRMVAESWLQEARLYLETKQSVNALCSIADAVVIGAQLEA